LPIILVKTTIKRCLILLIYVQVNIEDDKIDKEKINVIKHNAHREDANHKDGQLRNDGNFTLPTSDNILIYLIIR